MGEEQADDVMPLILTAWWHERTLIHWLESPNAVEKPCGCPVAVGCAGVSMYELALFLELWSPAFSGALTLLLLLCTGLVNEALVHTLGVSRDRSVEDARDQPDWGVLILWGQEEMFIYFILFIIYLF